jgi:hypothetical protein
MKLEAPNSVERRLGVVHLGNLPCSVIKASPG